MSDREVSVPPGQLDDPAQTTKKTIKGVYSDDEYTALIFSDKTWLLTAAAIDWEGRAELKHKPRIIPYAIREWIWRVINDPS